MKKGNPWLPFFVHKCAKILTVTLKVEENSMKSETFKITKEDDEKQGVARFSVVGRINSKNSPVLQNKLEDALNSGKLNIVLNMLQVEYLSSDGIRIILKIYREAAKMGGTFKIERPSEMVRNVIGMVALNDLLI